MDKAHQDLFPVSVVIPAYNSVRWIQETLSSVAAQTVGTDSLEVIVVDDGSNDGTAEAAERFLAETDLPWQVIRQQNRGPSAARNTGLRLAHGTWIQFLDADDLIDPEKIEIQLAVGSAADETVAVVYSPWTRFGVMDVQWDQPGRVVTPRTADDPVTALLNDAENAIATGSQLYRREWLNGAGGWDEALRNGEDHDLAFRVAFAGGRFTAASADRPLFFYRRHGCGTVSLTTLSGRANAEVWPRLAGYVEDQSRARGELTPERIRWLTRIYAGGARWLADYDWRAAQWCIDRLVGLGSQYRPEWSKKLQLLASVVGFRGAVWVASRVRRVVPVRVRADRLIVVPRPAFAIRSESGREVPI